MWRRKSQAEADDAPGAPEWMVTFSDCMTLLLTFFVLLLSFSSFDDKLFRKLKVIFTKGQSSVSARAEGNKDAFLSTRQIQRNIIELDKGSEKPTLSRGTKDNLKEDTEPVDFRSRRVFLVPSENIFWGKGTVISSGGRDIMDKMALYLKEVPNRIVISESGLEGDEGAEESGLPRAWAVMEYLTAKQGLDKKRFSISASSTSSEGNERNYPKREAERVVEIVLLERGVYN
jgi:chemotaxis protein MotB